MLFPWLVHLFTATGAVAAYLALSAGIDGDLTHAFLWLVVVTAVAAGAGAATRPSRAKESNPPFNGNRLHAIVDYLTVVFAPVVPDGPNGPPPARRPGRT